jgi:hypothetical protein
MGNDINVDVELSGYENTLVKQFRVLETLIEISKKERELILKNSSELLMTNTEEKEVVLDKFSLLEEDSRTIIQKILLKLDIRTERTSIQDVLPYLDREDSARINRLLDGINILVRTARQLNTGNQALVTTRMDWLKITQAFLVSLIHQEDGYTKPMFEGSNRNSTVSAMEFRA